MRCRAPYRQRERVVLWTGQMCPRMYDHYDTHPDTRWVEIHTGKPDELGNTFSPFYYCLHCSEGKQW